MAEGRREVGETMKLEEKMAKYFDTAAIGLEWLEARLSLLLIIPVIIVMLLCVVIGFPFWLIGKVIKRW